MALDPTRAHGAAPLRLDVTTQSFPVAGAFTIARGSRREAVVVVATLTSGDGALGRGECVPYARYGETVAQVIADIRAMAPALARGLDRAELQGRMPPGAARNALDCALWDLDAKRSGHRAHALAGLPEPTPLETAYTISLAAPEDMAEKAASAGERYPLLKLKLGGGARDALRLAAVRRAAPEARLIADANEAWHPEDLERLLAAAAEAHVALIEQPLPADADAALAHVARPVPVCADESVHTAEDLAALRDRYDAVNIKLDKAGGLTQALAMARAARAMGFSVMVGCMLASSLAMAPALLLACEADWVDLDGPLLLARDRRPGLVYEGPRILPAPPALWG